MRQDDRVITRDNGMHPVRWVGQRALGSADFVANPQFRPIMIRRGALGLGLPERDMMVSPNHRVLVVNDRNAMFFGEREVLVAAKHLLGQNGISLCDVPRVTYLHFMFDAHEVVLSNNARTESFQPGDYTLNGMDAAQRTEIMSLFPELDTPDGLPDFAAARRSLSRHEALLIGV